MSISPLSHRKAGKSVRCDGFTLAEISIVLVIIGIILAAAGLGWSSFLEARRIAKTAVILQDVKSSLIRRCVLTGRYPTYTGSTTAGTTADNLDCDIDTQHGTDQDVDVALCGINDAWGQKIYYLEGIADGGGAGLAGNFILSDATAGFTRVAPDSTSIIDNKKGVTVRDVAFVLISLGRNRVADHSSYANFNGGVQAGYIGDITGANVNFDTNDTDVAVEYPDDVILYVTANELIAAVAQ